MRRGHGPGAAAVLLWGAAALLVPGGTKAQAVPEPPPIQAGRAAPPGAYGALDVLDYRVTVGLPAPGGSEITGEAVLTLRPTRPGVEALVLDFTGLAVLEARVNGAVAPVSHQDGRLSVALPRAVGPGDTLEVTLRYGGAPDDGLILGRSVHGEPTAFVDNWPNRARFWLPSVDHPSDKATATVTVLAPEGWRVVGNGVLEVEGGDAPPAADGAPRRAWRWRMDVPVSTYNLVFGAGPLVTVPLGSAACGEAPASPRPDGCVEVTAWLFPPDTGQARLSFRRAPRMLDFYTGLVGPYPFQKLAHVQSSTRFGGMENASAIFYAEDGLAAGADIEGVVAHETAHQWFGDAVTEVDWPELWLSEGFATYFGHLFFEHADGPEAFRRLMAEDREEVLASPDVRRPVIERDEQDLFALLNDNNYPKGGWVLHMLRGILGDDVFFRGVRRYYADHRGGVVTTDDFRAAMEGVSGRELGWFFHQWLEAPGYPVLSLASTWDEAAGDVVLTVRQVQDPEWPVFRFPLEVELVLPGGIVRRERVEVKGAEESFRVPASGAPEAVTADPDVWLLHRDTGGR